ncbi:hypothetical protein PINS_up009749 [Pythium insidiosum]|nr:hypothetical protein PINS_up009749 [Pythium insidiosum]
MEQREAAQQREHREKLRALGEQLTQVQDELLRERRERLEEKQRELEQRLQQSSASSASTSMDPLLPTAPETTAANVSALLNTSVELPEKIKEIMDEWKKRMEDALHGTAQSIAASPAKPSTVEGHAHETEKKEEEEEEKEEEDAEWTPPATRRRFDALLAAGSPASSRSGSTECEEEKEDVEVDEEKKEQGSRDRRRGRRSTADDHRERVVPRALEHQLRELDATVDVASEEFVEPSSLEFGLVDTSLLDAVDAIERDRMASVLLSSSSSSSASARVPRSIDTLIQGIERREQKLSRVLSTNDPRRPDPGRCAAGAAGRGPV